MPSSKHYSSSSNKRSFKGDPDEERSSLTIKTAPNSISSHSLVTEDVSEGHKLNRESTMRTCRYMITASEHQEEAFSGTSENKGASENNNNTTNTNSRRNVDDDDNNDDDDKSSSSFNLGDPINDPNTCSGRVRNKLGASVNNRWVQIIITISIIVNSIILGVATFYEDDPKVNSILDKIDLVFLLLFTFESGFQLIYLGFIKFFKEGWLLYDGVIVSISWIFIDSQFSVFRSFRIFRLFTLVSRFSSLRRLFKAVADTIPKMATIGAALMLLFYTFCVLFTGLYRDLWEDGVLDEDYFGRLDYTFLTLFQMMTLDSWTSVVRQVNEEYPYSWIGFIVWVILTAFFVINLVVAVICESLLDISKVAADHGQKQHNNELLDEQKDMMENQTQELVNEVRQVLALQRNMLTNQVAMQNTIMELMKDVKELKKKAAASESLNSNSSHSRRPGSYNGNVGEKKAPNPSAMSRKQKQQTLMEAINYALQLVDDDTNEDNDPNSNEDEYNERKLVVDDYIHRHEYQSPTSVTAKFSLSDHSKKKKKTGSSSSRKQQLPRTWLEP